MRKWNERGPIAGVMHAEYRKLSLPQEDLSMTQLFFALIVVAIVSAPAHAEPQNGWPSSRDRFSDQRSTDQTARRPALATQGVTRLDRRIEQQDDAVERICPEC